MRLEEAAMIGRTALATAVLLCVASPAGAVTPLAIWVEPDGTSFLWNSTDSPIPFLGYQIQSEGNLDPAGFKGVGDYIAAGDWQTVIDVLGPGGLTLSNKNPSENFLLQAGVGAPAVLQGGDKFFIGAPFKTLPPSPSNRGEYLLFNEFQSRKLEIVYAPEPSAWLLALLAGLGLAATRKNRGGPKVRDSDRWIISGLISAGICHAADCKLPGVFRTPRHFVAAGACRAHNVPRQDTSCGF
jgi:hypothetical protein